MSDLETRLRSTLRSVAADTDVEERLHQVVAHEFRSHQPQSHLLVATAAFVVVGVGFGALLLISRGTDQTPMSSEGSAAAVTAPSPTVSAVAPPTLPNGDPWPLPRLALDTDQLDSQLVVVAAVSEFTPPNTELAGTFRPYLQVLRRDIDSFEPPMIWIETNDQGSDYLRSGFAQAESTEEFTINGTVFFLFEDGDRRLLTAGLPSGASVYITGLGVEAADLVGFASHIVEASPGPGWVVPEPPLGLQIVFEGHLPGIYDPPGYATQIVTYGNGAADTASAEGPATRVEFSVESRGEVSFERRLYETAGHATDKTLVRSGTVRNRPAAVVGWSGDAEVVVWRDTDEATAYLLVVSTEISIDQFLAALIEVDEDTWQAMQTNVDDLEEPLPPTIPPATSDG